MTEPSEKGSKVGRRLAWPALPIAVALVAATSAAAVHGPSGRSPPEETIAYVACTDGAGSSIASWAPDGGGIAYVDRARIVVVGRDGTAAVSRQAVSLALVRPGY